MDDKIPAAPEDDAPAPIAPFLGHRTRPARERLLEAALLVSGERGYEPTSVNDIIERAKVSRTTFYKYFEGKEDCFAQAYKEAAEWLVLRLFGAAKRRSSWREGLRAGLSELLEFCANQPTIARALLAEPQAAGGAALEQHDRLMERLADAIDGARREIDSRPGPPPVTATFMVGAVETLVRTKLIDGEAQKAPEMLPGLLHFVVMQYFGEDAAWEEMTAASVSTWQARRGAASQLP